jgi:antirestriction protein ArdC
MAANVYQIITDRIIEEMNKGVIPWQRPWHGAIDGAVSYETGRPYSFLNQFLLGRPGEWLTFNQIKKLGGKIKKGAKSGMVTFVKTYVKKGKGEVIDGEGAKDEMGFVLRYYNVFHIDDCEGIPTKIKKEREQSDMKPIELADKVANEYVDREDTLKLEVKLSNSAYYSPATDTVVVPQLDQYEVAEEFYSTLFHELVHSTGVSKRCDRGLNKVSSKHSDEYSREELVAEMGSAMILNQLGIDNEKAFKNSVAYVQSWLRELKNDNRMIVWAASRAEKAVKYIRGIKEDE